MSKRTAFVTGAAQRIGARIARFLHDAGMDLVVHYRSSARAADELRKELESSRPDSVLPLRADLLDDAMPTARPNIGDAAFGAGVAGDLAAGELAGIVLGPGAEPHALEGLAGGTGSDKIYVGDDDIYSVGVTVTQPIFMGGAIAVQVFLKDKVDITERRFAVIDLDGRLFDSVAKAAEARNADQIFDDNGKQVKPRFTPVPAGDAEFQRGQQGDRLPAAR